MPDVLTPTGYGKPRLQRRVPVQTDLRIFTMDLIPAGRHRPDRARPRLRVVRSRLTGEPVLRSVTPGVSNEWPPLSETCDLGVRPLPWLPERHQCTPHCDRPEVER